MFAYCENDPINRWDPNGELANWIIGAAVGAVVGGIISAINGEGFYAGAAQGFVSGLIAGAAIDIALASIATFGAAGIVTAGVISYYGGYVGNIAGEETKSIIQGKGFAPIDSDMKQRSRIAGVVSVGAFAFSAILGYANNGLQPVKRMVSRANTFINEVKNNLLQVTKASTDIASIHGAVHYAIHGSVLTSQTPRSIGRYAR